MAVTTTRALAYIRTATHTQTARELNTAVQAQRIERYCAEQDVSLVGSFVDYGVSGNAMDRAGLHSVLSLLAAGQADLLIVTNVCRLTRSVDALAKLVDTYFGDRAHGLVSLDENLDTRTANGRFVLGLLTVIARWESEVLYHG